MIRPTFGLPWKVEERLRAEDEGDRPVADVMGEGTGARWIGEARQFLEQGARGRRWYALEPLARFTSRMVARVSGPSTRLLAMNPVPWSIPESFTEPSPCTWPVPWSLTVVPTSGLPTIVVGEPWALPR